METSPKHARDVTNTSLKDPKTPPKKQQNNTETSPKKDRDKTETRPRHDRDITKTTPRHHRDNTKTRPRHDRDKTETRPRQDRDILGEFFSGACTAPSRLIHVRPQAYRYWGINLSSKLRWVCGSMQIPNDTIRWHSLRRSCRSPWWNRVQPWTTQGDQSLNSSRPSLPSRRGSTKCPCLKLWLLWLNKNKPKKLYKYNNSWNRPTKNRSVSFKNQVTCRNPKLTTVSQSNATQVWNIAAIQSCHSLGERTSWWSFWAHALPPILNLAETPTTCTPWPAAFCLVDASKVVAIGCTSSPKRTQEEAIWTCVPTMSMVKAIHQDISALVLCKLKVTDLCGFQVEQVVVTTAAKTCDDRCIWSMTPAWMIKACSPVCLLFSAGQIPSFG